MERQNAKLLNDVLQDLIKEEGLEDELYKVRLFEAWDKTVGPMAASATSNKFFKNGILYCTISSSVLRSQLYYNLEGILNTINTLFSDHKIIKIVLK